MMVCTQVLYGVNQRVRTEDVDSPLCEIRPVKSVQLVVMTGDRGLCGGYNTFILKKVCLCGHVRACSMALCNGSGLCVGYNTLMLSF
jgi:F0F1-type ATP synthase gamma subunit